MKVSDILKEAVSAIKKYNSEKKMWQYITLQNEVILTCKTEKSLDMNYKKYLKSIS